MGFDLTLYWRVRSAKVAEAGSFNGLLVRSVSRASKKSRVVSRAGQGGEILSENRNSSLASD